LPANRDRCRASWCRNRWLSCDRYTTDRCRRSKLFWNFWPQGIQADAADRTSDLGRTGTAQALWSLRWSDTLRRLAWLALRARFFPMTPTPDFAQHDWHSIESARVKGSTVILKWADGAQLVAYSLWLFEQTVGVEERTREATIEPGDLPNPDCLADASVNDDGSLHLVWHDVTNSDVDPGWLYSIARSQHLPMAAIGERRRWTAADFSEPPTFDGSRVLEDIDVFETWLHELCTTGLARLRATPATDGFLSELAARIGPIRGSNFGGVFTVESVVDPDSTANTGLALGQHTDLPTRETPPGFQFLHCVENTAAGGASRMADGVSVVEELRVNHPAEFDALTTLNWVFANRAPDGDHRWVGPIVDFGGPQSALTIRAFYPVRLAPAMPASEQPRAYAALRVFSQIAHDPRFMITSLFEPGDLVGFDNRRVLHGRNAFDVGGGRRRLRGCYIDHDDVYSRLRVVRRPGTSPSFQSFDPSQGVTS
jgi:gamma-butyrobetaine dioxygenase